MKKRIIGILLAAAIVLGLAGCGVKPPGNEEEGNKTDADTDSNEPSDTAKTFELALITDVGTIDDKSFNQGSWEGLELYAKEHFMSYKYYKPTEKSDEACLNAIDLAVKGGARVIVTPGFLFEVPIFQAQDKYPDVTFVLIDGAPHNGDGNVVVKENVLSINYAEEQAGYLAGYAAVMEGYTKLGFMGGIAVPAVIRYGYGFIQGADAAAASQGIAKDEITIKYTYVGNFDASPENNALAAAWYNDGTEVIFACGGGVGNSVMKAAESAETKVIGVDVDQSGESPTVITSAMKNLLKSVYEAIASEYEGNFEGGQTVTSSAKDFGIQLPMETSKFTMFKQADYDALYAKLADGSVKVENDTIAPDAAKVPTKLVKVDLIK
jgi:basic membrane protein A